MKKRRKVFICILFAVIAANIIYYLYISQNKYFDCTWVVLLWLPIWCCFLGGEVFQSELVRTITRRLGSCGLIFFVLVIFFIYWGGATTVEGKGYQYVVVLGSGFEGDTISQNALRRLDTALQCKEDSIYVVAGGLKNEHTEAYFMKEYLMECGVSENCIIMEDKSTDTYENLRNAKLLIGAEEIVVVTSRFHLWRSMKLAESVGFENVKGVAAPVEPQYALYCYMREIGAICREILLNRIFL